MARYFNRQVVLGKGLLVRVNRALRTLVSDEGVNVLANLTDAERNALDATNGMLIYNTTSDELQAYVNGSWVTLAEVV